MYPSIVKQPSEMKSPEKMDSSDVKASFKEYPPVLVVDDDMMNIEVMSSMLLARGINSESALNGNLAI